MVAPRRHPVREEYSSDLPLLWRHSQKIDRLSRRKSRSRTHQVARVEPKSWRCVARGVVFAFQRSQAGIRTAVVLMCEMLLCGVASRRSPITNNIRSSRHPPSLATDVSTCSSAESGRHYVLSCTHTVSPVEVVVIVDGTDCLVFCCGLLRHYVHLPPLLLACAG